MWAIIGSLLIGVVISIFEIPPLIKKKWWKEMVVYFIFLSAGLTLTILVGKRVNIPSPLDFIIKIYTPITKFFQSILS